MARRKPSELVVGKAYRLYCPFSRDPSEDIALVTEIRRPTKTSRLVILQWLSPGPGWNSDNYTAFLRRVHSEAPTAIN